MSDRVLEGTAAPDGGIATAALPREMILASAGSGKTFRISSRIIGLLAHGEPPEAILASTFTRKAAGEILGRVLGRLAEAALDPEKARELETHAALGPAREGEEPGSRLDSDRCLELLTGVVRQLHRLSVGTLDALFMRTARSFAHELALPAAWGIADDPTSRRVRSEALQEVLRRGDAGAIVELVRLANRGQASRSVLAGLLRHLDELHRIHHQLDPEVADPWAIYPGLAAAREPEADGARLARAIEAVDPPRTKAGTPHKGWMTALSAAADAIRVQNWEAFASNIISQKILGGESEYYKLGIPDDVHLLFQEILERACRAIGRQLSAQARAMGRLVSLFDEAFTRVQRREGAYRFEDVTRFIGGAAPLGARPDLHYRLDARLRHVLLDEFQDTSIPQWAALRPLVDAMLAGAEGGRAAIIVADPKQSIYGWRGANPRLVYGVGERYALAQDVLARSWRSSQVVLDAVNEVFEAIASSPVLDEADRAVAADWARAFTRHQAAKDLPGYVRIAIGPADAGSGNHRPRLLAHAAELVRGLREEAPGFSIGVLTRENRAVARIILELRRLGVEASEEGGNPLTDSAAVASVLALLRLADHPGDRIARYHVARTPVGEAVGFGDPGDDAEARRLAHRIRQRLLRDGYGATLDSLAQKLVPACDAREARRLMQLVESAFRYDDRATLRPTDFARLVEAERIEDPTAATVRVMTIHQSKGLEFDIVVLPELDGPVFKGGGQGALPYREDPTGPITRVFPYVSAGLRPLFPEIEAAYRQARAAVLRDALSTLYVAMTRARHALHLVLKPDGKSGPGQAVTPAMLVRSALAPDTAATAGDAAFYAAGDPRWPERARRPEGGETLPAAVAVLALELRRDASHRSRLLPRRTPSGLEGGPRVDLRQRLRLDTARSLERGSVIHAWCQEIGWIEDGLPHDERLSLVARRIARGLAAEDAAELVGRFRSWIGAPAISAALGRAAYPEGARVEREIRFIHRDADAIVEGVIDRLVLRTEGGRVVGAEVLDFKTDAVPADDPEEIARRADFYRPQLAAYRAAVGAAYRLDPQRVGAKLLFLQAGVVMGV